MPTSTTPLAGRVGQTCEFITVQGRGYSALLTWCVPGVAPSGRMRVASAAAVESGSAGHAAGAPDPSLMRRNSRRRWCPSRPPGPARGCGPFRWQRVARLLRVNSLRALHGLCTRRWSVARPAAPIPNLLRRRFSVTRANGAWLTGIIDSRTSQRLPSGSHRTERIKSRTYSSRELATADVADDIPAFRTPSRRHRCLGGAGPTSSQRLSKPSAGGPPSPANSTTCVGRA